MLCELIQDLDLHAKVPDKVSRGAQIMEEYKKACTPLQRDLCGS